MRTPDGFNANTHNGATRPFYYGCPLEFLDLAHDEINQEWRERLTHEHQA